MGDEAPGADCLVTGTYQHKTGEATGTALCSGSPAEAFNQRFLKKRR